MIDFKDFNKSSHHETIDSIATGIAWIVVTFLLLFYVLGMKP